MHALLCWQRAATACNLDECTAHVCLPKTPWHSISITLVASTFNFLQRSTADFQGQLINYAPCVQVAVI